jgi:hypothetical protein
MARTARLLALLVLVAVAGCRAAGAPDSAGAMRFTWFSYLNADDLRGRCKEGGPPLTRLVYNAVFTEQVRTYDLTGQPDGGARVQENLYRGAQLLDVTSLGILNRPDHMDWRFAPPVVAELEKALAQAGAFGPPPVGLIMRSDDYYWLVAACRDGTMTYHGYRSKALKGLPFFDVLNRYDPLGEPLPEPKKLAIPAGMAAPLTTAEGRDNADPYFHIQIGEDGLVGLSAN